MRDLHYAFRLIGRQPAFAALLALTSLAAMLGPARRAAGVEPIVALRAD